MSEPDPYNRPYPGLRSHTEQISENEVHVEIKKEIPKDPKKTSRKDAEKAIVFVIAIFSLLAFLYHLHHA